jgi:signal peptidase I
MTSPATPDTLTEPVQPTEKRNEGSLVRFLVGLAVIAWAFRSFLIAVFYIPTPSMVPTLYNGDYLFVAKWPYGYSRFSFPFGFPSFKGRIFANLPARGDVVVFRHPVEDSDLIKRVIGLPGDTVEVRAGRLILNGKPVTVQPTGEASVAVSPNSPCRRWTAEGASIQNPADGQCRYRSYRETLPGGPSYTILDQRAWIGDDFPLTQVPNGHLFVMGDNRDDSLDSRFSSAIGGVGFLPTEHLVGRALVTVWSTDGSASYFLPWTWFTALRGSRIGNGYTGDAE